MNVFRLYVWKEWREQRAGLAFLLAIVPALFGLLAYAWDAAQAEAFLRSGLTVATGALIALLVVGTDLVPSELRRGRVRFLERVPTGLSGAFLAKLAFFVATTTLLAFYSGIVASALHTLRFGAGAGVAVDPMDERYVLPAIAIATWTFAVSSWVPHGALAVPTAVIAAGVLCSPAWYFFRESSPIVPTIAEVRAFCVVSALGAAASAWASFALGLRRGGGPAAAAKVGALVAVLALSPAWAWCAWRLHRASTIDPKDPRTYVLDARMDASGERVLLLLEQSRNLLREDGTRLGRAWFGVTVDAKGRGWSSLGNLGGPGMSDWPAPLRGCPPAEELGLPSTISTTRWAGLGLEVRQRTAEMDCVDAWFDPFRCKVYRADELFPDGGFRFVWIRRGEWIVSRSRGALCELFDPDTRSSTPLFELVHGMFPPLLVVDGRALVADHGRVVLFSPEERRSTEIELRGFPNGVVRELWDPSAAHRAVDGSSTLAVSTGDDTYALARLDVERGELVATATSRGPIRLVAREPNDSVLAIEERKRLVRLRFGSDERVVLFPR